MKHITLAGINLLSILFTGCQAAASTAEPPPLNHQPTAEQALPQFEIVVDEAAPFTSQGHTAALGDDFQTALDAFSKAIQLEPDNANHYYNRGLIHFEMKAYDAAYTDFTGAISLNPDAAIPYFHRARTFELLENHSDAGDDYLVFLRLYEGEDEDLRTYAQQRSMALLFFGAD